MLVLTGMDYSKKDEVYEQAKRSLMNFMGESGGRATGATPIQSAIKLEPAYISEEEAPVMFTRFRGGNRSYTSNRYQRGQRPWRWLPRSAGPPTKVTNRPVNPLGPDGRRLLCKACGPSYRHMIGDCPDSWESLARVNISEESKHDKSPTENEEAVLFTGYRKNTLQELAWDAHNCAVLDSACCSTVCGSAWLENYLHSMSSSDRQRVTRLPGTKVFKFWGGEVMKSKEAVCIPAVMAGQQVRINTDVVDSDIPLLLSKDSMKKARVKLDLEHDAAEILDLHVPLNSTTSGHYCVPLIPEEMTVNDVHTYAVTLHALQSEYQYRWMLKLHRHAHPSEDKLKALLKDAGAWHDKLQDCLTNVQNKCELCKMYKRTPSRPVVSLPQANRFNEKVAMDLKKWGSVWILHMVDTWSRYSMSVFIHRKRPREVLDKLMQQWIGIFGVMDAILTDNGGEFTSDEMREVVSVLNI